jgi:hypothetical protein
MVRTVLLSLVLAFGGGASSVVGLLEAVSATWLAGESNSDAGGFADPWGEPGSDAGGGWDPWG